MNSFFELIVPGLDSQGALSIIMMFNDMSINRYKAQLIFTSHDLSTMNSEVFRRDEIWFVAKGNAQNSKLYSLVEFKNEKGESVRKDAEMEEETSPRVFGDEAIQILYLL